MREALIVWGGWNGHEPEQCARILAKMLEGRDFKVYVENTTEAFADPGIVDMSLIVPIVTMSKIEKEEVENLTTAVRGGVGLAGYHGGMCDAFRESVDYSVYVRWSVGRASRQYHQTTRSKFQSRTTRSWPESRRAFPSDPSNIICMSIPRMRCSPPRPFPANTRPGPRGVVMPVDVPKRRHGEVRVLYTSLGHLSAEFDVPEKRTNIERGILLEAR